MPLQNRVTPEGEILAFPQRGTLMGNRGCLHGADRRLGRARWRTKAWIACLLEFRGRRREVMAPGRYTELFFLDEATACAAGHRPCAECRRAEFVAFRDLWARVHGPASAPGIDAALHAARLTPSREKAAYPADPRSLPGGTIFRHGGLFLCQEGAALPWTPGGYGAPLPLPRATVEVLTPRPMVEMFAAGFAPAVHRTARLP